MAGGRYPSVSASEGGWTGSSLSDLPPYPHYPVIAEARHLFYCDALPLCQLTLIFRLIPLVSLLVSILRYILVTHRESMKEVGQHTLKPPCPRYDCSLNLLK
jgi:hypothetical protein